MTSRDASAPGRTTEGEGNTEVEDESTVEPSAGPRQPGVNSWLPRSIFPGQEPIEIGPPAVQGVLNVDADGDVEDVAKPEPEEAEPAPISEELARMVERQVLFKTADRLARQQMEAGGAAFDIARLSDVLERSDEIAYRAEGLMLWDASTLIVAQRKTGKTTLCLNIARCLYTGEELLGQFPTRKITGNVAVLNFEVSAAQIARWAYDVDVPGQTVMVNARGTRNPLLLDQDRALLVKVLKAADVESVIVDPFGRAYTGKSQNDPGEVGAWLVGLDQLFRGEAGVKDIILTTHAGWNGERSRGSSSLEDWADSIVNLTKDEDGRTFFRAKGRDVEVEEDQVHYDPATRWLTLTGNGSRTEQAGRDRLGNLLDEVVAVVRSQPGINGVQVGERLRERKVPFQRGEENKALALALRDGTLTFHAGPKGGKQYSIAVRWPPK